MKKDVNLFENFFSKKLFLIIFLLFFIIILIFLFSFNFESKREYYLLQDNQCSLVEENPSKVTFSHYSTLEECETLINNCDSDEDCVKVQIGCCNCNMGGEEKCVLKSEEEDYLMKLSECSSQTLCSAVYNCEIEACRCINGVCIA